MDYIILILLLAVVLLLVILFILFGLIINVNSTNKEIEMWEDIKKTNKEN